MNSHGRLVLRVSGEIDVETAPWLQRWLDSLGTTGHLSVDLAEVDFMDSSGLVVLLQHLVRMRDAGGSLVINEASATVRRLFEMCCLDHLLTDGS